MARFECERCGTRKTANVIYGYPSREDFEQWAKRDDIVSGGCVIEHDSPSRVCIVCHWPMADDWNAFDGPRSPEFDLFQRPIDQALDRYDETANLAELGLSFDGYAAFGSLERVAEVTDGVEERWQRTGKVPTHLGKLRTCLFFEQRASRHNGSPLERPYTQALVKALRKAAASAGEVSHKGCFVCDPHGPGLQITFERDEPGGVIHAAFTIDQQWATPDGYIPQAIVAAILDDCLTHTASAAAHRRMRVQQSKVEFHSQLRPGQPYTATGRVSGADFPPRLPAEATIQEEGGWPLAIATSTMVPGPLPASVIRR